MICLIMAVVMTVGIPATTYAADYQGQDGWLVNFDGEELKSNFESGNLADEAANIQPGDSIELKVQIQNSSEKNTDWYMTNEVIQTLEDDSVAAGGAYEYRLRYVSAAGEETILYDSSSVGGENTAQSGEGLYQATDSLEDYFYLDRLAKNDKGTVYLWIRIDGETQGNGYQETLAELQMNFAVEEVAEATTTTVNRVIRQTVKTGDQAPLMFFSFLALVSGLILLGAGIYVMNQKRRRKKGE